MVILITENHLITFWGGLQAQRADFKEYPHFFLLFSRYYGMLSSTLYGKEGTPAMGWNGCVFFKKGNP